MSYFQCNSLMVDVTTVIRYQYVFGNGNYCANLHQVDIEQCIFVSQPCVGSGVVRIDPLHFLA